MMVLNNTTSMLNATTVPAFSMEGGIVIFLGLIGIVIAFYIMYKVLKNLIANAVIGGVGLVLLHFIVPYLSDFEVPLDLLNILIAVVAGLPGLVIVLVKSILGL